MGRCSLVRESASLELSAGNPENFAVTINGFLNGAPFICGKASFLPLPEGTGTAQYMAISSSGQMASRATTWKRDATPPKLRLVVPPVDGKNNRCISMLDVLTNANDSHSSILSVEVLTRV